MKPCIFCAINAGEAPAALIRQDQYCSVFLDIHPMQTGHLLIVPKVHAQHLLELPPVSRAHLFATAQHLMAALDASELKPAGFNLLLNDGAAANQTVPHVHLHVVPRRGGDLGRLLLGFARRIGGVFGRPTPYPRLEETAALIRTALSRAQPQQARPEPAAGEHS